LRSPKAPRNRPPRTGPRLKTPMSGSSPPNLTLVTPPGASIAAGRWGPNLRRPAWATRSRSTYPRSPTPGPPTVTATHGATPRRAPQFTFVISPVDATGTFTSGLNGQITASLTAQPPGAPQSFIDAAPKGQHVALFSVSYTTVTLADTTNAVFVSLADQSA